MGSNYPQESWNNWLYDSCLMALLASMYVLLIYFVVFWRGPKIVDPKSPSFEKGLYEENSLNQKNSHDIPPNNLKTCIFFCEKRTDHPGHYYVFCARAKCVPISKERCLRCTKVKDHLLFSKLKNCPMTCIAPHWGVSRLH